MKKPFIVQKVFDTIENTGTMRQKYMLRFFFRVFVLICAFLLYFFRDESYSVLEPGRFFSRFSMLHLLWAVWFIDMLFKIFPLRGMFALGATKQSKNYFKASLCPATKELLRKYIRRENRRALYVFVIWTCLGIAIALLAKIRLLGRKELFLLSVIFYLCDLICVLFWCPFRTFFLHNRCCTTCRIFNWDHLMMTTPLICVNSLFSWSLVLASAAIFILWEFRVHRFPERFYEGINDALKCKNCTDFLCGKQH